MGFSIVSLVAYFLRFLRKLYSKTLSFGSSSSSSYSSVLHAMFFWIFASDHDDQESEKKNVQENQDCHETVEAKGLVIDMKVQENRSILQENFEVSCGAAEKKSVKKERKRPARLVVPVDCCTVLELSEMANNNKKNKRVFDEEELEVEGKDFCLASKKGRREVMEDGYGVTLDILGDPKQAIFTVIDGHGGRAAADYVAENLGKNIVKALEDVAAVDKEVDHSEQAVRGGYLVTDIQFLSQGIGSGACAASVLLKDGELHAANIGDCRVVLSRNGVAHVLTNDHRLSREDERVRVENSGGFVQYCHNGIWRVNGTLAVSRAIGDINLKEWVISEPEIKKICLTSDCQFLIIASDGLWDKVSNQEAVDHVVYRGNKSMKLACKELVNISCSRGNMDDITVMVINLQNFVPT